MSARLRVPVSLRLGNADSEMPALQVDAKTAASNEYLWRAGIWSNGSCTSTLFSIINSILKSSKDIKILFLNSKYCTFFTP